MIHLDANLLIGASDPANTHHATARRVLAAPGPFAVSAVAWTEFCSKPLQPTFEVALRSALRGGILAFDESAAALAGELFYRTGSDRRTRLDCMIAATTIQAGAELATADHTDFAPFEPHGLKLFPMP